MSGIPRKHAYSSPAATFARVRLRTYSWGLGPSRHERDAPSRGQAVRDSPSRPLCGLASKLLHTQKTEPPCRHDGLLKENPPLYSHFSYDRHCSLLCWTGLRLGQPELFEAQRQVRRLSGRVAYQGKRPEVRAREMVFPIVSS